jgi:hypothetical protein
MPAWSPVGRADVSSITPGDRCDEWAGWVGAAADTLEAAERGLPKSPAIRTNTDSEPELADMTTKQIANFHRAHPDIALVPAHDRVAPTSSVIHQPALPISTSPNDSLEHKESVMLGKASTNCSVENAAPPRADR